MEQTGNIDQSGTRSFSRRKEQRPREILDAALKEFSLNGFSATRLDDVASRAGICKGTIYLYFSSKEELFIEVVRDKIFPHLEKLEKQGKQASGSTRDILREQLKTIYREFLSSEARFIPKLIISEGSRFPELTEFYYKEIIIRVHKLMASVIRRGVEKGEFRQSALKWEQQAVLSPALAAVIWKTVFDHLDPMDLDEYMETHVDLLLHGLEIKD